MIYAGYYLLGLKNNNTEFAARDGVHDSPDEVQKAMVLYERLGLAKLDESYFMIYVPQDIEVVQRPTERSYREALNRTYLELVASEEIKLQPVPTQYSVIINEEAAGLVASAISNGKQTH